MNAATAPEKDTLSRKIASRFCWPLTATDYQRLNAIIARTRAARHAWSILAYNCNDFVADLARGIGMQTPTTLSLPYNFIPTLEAMNEHKPRPVRALPSARPAVTALRQTAVVHPSEKFRVRSRLPSDPPRFGDRPVAQDALSQKRFYGFFADLWRIDVACLPSL